MPEWLNGAVSKTVVFARIPGVRIPLSPPFKPSQKGLFNFYGMANIQLYSADLLTKFLKFGLVGASGVLVDFGVTYLLKEKAKIHQYIANGIGFTAAATTNYFLNRLYTFHSQNPQILQEYGKFIAVSMVGLIINSVVIWFLVSKWKWNFYFAKIFAIGAATIWNFFANLLVTFV